MHLAEWMNDNLDAPEYNLGDVHMLAMGNCNLKRAKGYIGHFANWMECFINPQYPTVYVFTEIPSRFMDTEKIEDAKDIRHLVIDFDDKELAKLTTEEQRDQYWHDNIRGHTALDFLQKGRQYYCSCKSGARTVNPCAHITAVLVFIFLAKWGNMDEYLDEIKPTHYDDPMDCIKYKRWLEGDESSNSAQDPAVSAQRDGSAAGGERGRGGRRGNRRSRRRGRGGGDNIGGGRGGAASRGRGYGPQRGQGTNMHIQRGPYMQRVRGTNTQQLSNNRNMDSNQNRNVHRGRGGDPNGDGTAGVPRLEPVLRINFNL